MYTTDELRYSIEGQEMQYVMVYLKKGQCLVAEAGALMMMDEGIQMQAIMGDGSSQGGLLGKVLSVGKRMLTGESLFMTLFENTVIADKRVAFASPYPGKITSIDLNQYDGNFICQKDAFLFGTRGTTIGVEFSRKLGRGLFGGEGFIMQRIKGKGKAFIHAGGTMAFFDLKAGEKIKVDTGCIVGFSSGVNYDIKFVGGIKNALFGGEGLFLATLEGPGTVILQSLPFSRLAGRIYSAAPQTMGGSKEEGSILGGLGNLLNGDNR